MMSGASAGGALRDAYCARRIECASIVERKQNRADHDGRSRKIYRQVDALYLLNRGENSPDG